MYKNDYLMALIENFFNTVKKLTRTDINIVENDFEVQFNSFLLKNFGIEIAQIGQLDVDLFSQLIYNDENKKDLVIVFLKMAKVLKLKNLILSQLYVELAHKILTKKTVDFVYDDGSKDQIISNLLKSL